MSLVVVGTSYKTSPLAVRERAAVAEGELDAALHALAASEGMREVAVLSTCNRVECYVEAATDRLGAEACLAWYAARLGTSFARKQFYVIRGADAVEHVFRVVCSLDSQVLGEAQILGQMRRAFEWASEVGTCGEVLTELLKDALRLGKRVRSETLIGADSVSLSTTAIRAAQRVVGDLGKARVVLVGAGQMSRLTARYLEEAGCEGVLVTSPTAEHAEELSRSLGRGARAVPFARRYEALASVDVAFCATSSPEPVICACDLAAALMGRADQALTIVDEAVPRDVEQACGELPGVTLFDQESLTSHIDEGLAGRLGAVGDVERMVDEAVADFLGWMQGRMLTPTIREMYEKGSAVLDGELKRARKELERQAGRPLTPGEERALEAYGNAIVKKLLHGPVVRLRKEAQDSGSYYYTEAARYLFGLDTLPPGLRHRCRERPCERGGSCPWGLVRVSQVACGSAGTEGGAS